MTAKNLILILKDHLSLDISSMVGISPNDVIMISEVFDPNFEVKHHKKKLAFQFSAMRHFARILQEKGYQVEYIKVTDNKGKSLLENVEDIIKRNSFDQLIMTEPSEYHLLQEVKSWQKKLSIDMEIRYDDRFLCTPKEFASWAQDHKVLRLEYFYQMMRKRYNILIDNEKPAGGKWNYDSENRKPPETNIKIPKPYSTTPDDITLGAIADVSKLFSKHFGDLEGFHFAVNRSQALAALRSFIKDRLPLFGTYQDAMLEGEPWMYHSHISLYINIGLLNPMECIAMAEKAYRDSHAPLNAVEGFIRQILGWREYVRGIYWLKMPKYEQSNFLAAKNPLPEFYWSGKTEMNCLKQCVLETKHNAYAHHIQRLMVLGNFALLTAIDPVAINQWYWIVYADAYHWVELPNVHGMILFADGGILASKPYAASGSYINRMSNYCRNCSYDVKTKLGAKACPFNYLYWNFLLQNEGKLKSNPRLGIAYNNIDKMDSDQKSQIKKEAKNFIAGLDTESESVEY